MLKEPQKLYFIPVDAHGQELRDQGRERELVRGYGEKFFKG